MTAYGAGHVGLPTDAGFGHAWAGTGGFAAVGHRTTAITGSAAIAHGTAVRTSFNHYNTFNGAWYHDHPGAWFAAGWTAGRAWTAATWPSVGAWCGWGSVQPIYYDYGTNIIYQGDEVYYGDQPAATADEYYQQAQNLADSAPQADSSTPDWMPLGVFSLVQGDQSDTNAVFQLAVNKAGAIAGNYSSELTGTTLPVHGAVDKKSQRAAWTVGDNKTTVYDTGMDNLTKDQAPLLVHFGKDRTEQWMLVRLQQPQGSSGQQ